MAALLLLLAQRQESVPLPKIDLKKKIARALDWSADVADGMIGTPRPSKKRR